jgi:hypothetical protein
MDNVDRVPMLYDIHFYRSPVPSLGVPQSYQYESCGLPKVEAKKRLAEIRELKMHIPYKFFIKLRGSLPKSTPSGKNKHDDELWVETPLPPWAEMDSPTEETPVEKSEIASLLEEEGWRDDQLGDFDSE